MTKTTEITFVLNGTTYTRKANGYCYAQQDGSTTRIGKAEFIFAHNEYKEMEEEISRREAEEVAKYEDAKALEEAAEAHGSGLNEEEGLKAVSASKTEGKAKKAARKAKKNAAFTLIVGETEITLTEKQVDFIRHLPDTCFWENGLDSCIWVDVLCDEIGGQFENKPMTVGAMISTICEKGLGTRGTDRRNGRKVTFFALTDLGKVVAKELGLE